MSSQTAVQANHGFLLQICYKLELELQLRIEESVGGDRKANRSLERKRRIHT